MKKTELMKWARYFNVKGRSKMSVQELKAEIYELTAALDFWVDMNYHVPIPYRFIPGEGIVKQNLIEMYQPLDQMWRRVAEEDKCWEQFNQHLEGNCIKAEKKMWQAWRMAKLHQLDLGADSRTSPLEDKIIEALVEKQKIFDDPKQGAPGRPLPKKEWNVVKKFQRRIHDLRFKEKELEYEEWAMLSNWVNRLLSNKKRYKVKGLQDREEVWAEIAAQDMFLWQSSGCQDKEREPFHKNGDKEQEEALQKLEQAFVNKHYADMSKVEVSYLHRFGNPDTPGLVEGEDTGPTGPCLKPDLCSGPTEPWTDKDWWKLTIGQRSSRLKQYNRYLDDLAVLRLEQ